MTTPEEAVREARTGVILAITSAAEAFVFVYDEAEQRKRNDAGDLALDALLIAERARLAARVSEMERLSAYACEGDTADCLPDKKGQFLSRASVLALLREPV